MNNTARSPGHGKGLVSLVGNALRRLAVEECGKERDCRQRSSKEHVRMLTKILNVIRRPGNF